MNTIGKKLSFVFGILFIFMLTIGGVAGYSLVAIKNKADDLASISLRLEKVGHMKENLFKVLNINKSYVEGAAENQFEFDVLIFELESIIYELERMDLAENERPLINSIKENLKLLNNKTTLFLQNSNPTGVPITNESGDILFDEIDDIRTDIINSSEKVFYLIYGKFENTKLSVKEVRDLGIILTIGFTFLAILFGGLGTLFFTKRFLLNPIKALKQAAVAIGYGNYETKIEINSNDEIGVLGSAFETMSSQIKRHMESLELRKKELEKEISQRQQTEKKLKVVSDQNRLILNFAGEGIYGLDLNGHTIFCNPAAAKMIGYEVEELIGKPQHDILHHSKPDGSPYPREECPIYAAFKDGGVHHVSNEVFWKKDGTSFPVEYVSTPVEEKGKLVGAVVIFRDITERKKAENLSIRLGRILDNSFNEIYMFDASALKFIQVSQGACMNLGYSMEELRQLTPLDLNPEFTPEQFQALINPLRQGIKEIIIFETDHKRKNGTRYPVEVRLQLAKMETPHMFIAIIQDITERKKAEEKNKEHIAELEHFTYSASHDLQEPLRKILLFGSRLSESSSSSLGREERDYISRMEKASLRMKNLIEDLLEYSQLAHLGYNFELTDLTEVVKEVIDDLEIQIEESKGFIQFDSLPHIQADKTRMRQLFQNMISNSLKFSQPDTPPEIFIKSAPGQNGFYEISIEDNGIGFDDKYHDKIFRPFHRLHARGEYQGTGMGLFICRKIVKGHGGTIIATSQPKKGSKFVITLPEKQLKPA